MLRRNITVCVFCCLVVFYFAKLLLLIRCCCVCAKFPRDVSVVTSTYSALKTWKLFALNVVIPATP